MKVFLLLLSLSFGALADSANIKYCRQKTAFAPVDCDRAQKGFTFCYNKTTLSSEECLKATSGFQTCFEKTNFSSQTCLRAGDGFANCFATMSGEACLRPLQYE